MYKIWSFYEPLLLFLVPWFNDITFFFSYILSFHKMTLFSLFFFQAVSIFKAQYLVLVKEKCKFAIAEMSGHMQILSVSLVCKVCIHHLLKWKERCWLNVVMQRIGNDFYYLDTINVFVYIVFLFHPFFCKYI